jgi:hypothetical protein
MKPEIPIRLTVAPQIRKSSRREGCARRGYEERSKPPRSKPPLFDHHD